MSEFELDKLDIDGNVSLSVHNKQIAIRIKGYGRLAFVNYTEELFEMMKKARFKVPKTQKAIENDKYPYSNEYKKKLHHMVFDYHFGEDVRKKLHESDYIIEHLDNNGFNCNISNLYFLKKIKNTYKGWYFDKESKKARPIIALKMYHIIDNETFQISIFFNQTFVDPVSNKALSTVRLLYDYNYEIVLQDAEQILESITSTGRIKFTEWKDIYRYRDIEKTYAPDIELTEEEKKQDYGTFIFRDGKAYLLIGVSEDSVGLVNSIPYKEDWDLEE